MHAPPLTNETYCNNSNNFACRGPFGECIGSRWNPIVTQRARKERILWLKKKKENKLPVYSWAATFDVSSYAYALKPKNSTSPTVCNARPLIPLMLKIILNSALSAFSVQVLFCMIRRDRTVSLVSDGRSIQSLIGYLKLQNNVT